MKNKVVVFAPHPDDETLACGGTIAKKISEGYEVIIVVVTDGRYAFLDLLNINSDPTPSELKEIRKKEAQRAAKILGVCQENLMFLDIEEGTLEKNERIARKRITEILEESLPKEVYFPQKNEFNYEHVVTNRLVRNVINQFQLRPVEYQYLIAWSFPFNLISRLQPKCLKWLILTNFFKLDRVCVNVSDFISVKKAAINEYKSQFKLFSDKQQSPLFKESFFHKFLHNEEEFFISR